MTFKAALGWGVATAVALVGGMVVGIAAGSAVFESLPGHLVEPAKIGLAAVPALAGILGGGAAWGWLMARLAGVGATGRWVRAGVLGYSLPVMAAVFGLQALEPTVAALAERSGEQALPIHVVFTLLFVPTAFLIAAAGAGALGVALHNGRLAGRLALYAGSAAGLTFLAVVLVMDALGWRVGAPGAAERFTMLTVLMVSSVGAALAGGTAVGAVLGRTRTSVYAQ